MNTLSCREKLKAASCYYSISWRFGWHQIALCDHTSLKIYCLGMYGMDFWTSIRFRFCIKPRFGFIADWLQKKIFCHMLFCIFRTVLASLGLEIGRYVLFMMFNNYNLLSSFKSVYNVELHDIPVSFSSLWEWLRYWTNIWKRLLFNFGFPKKHGNPNFWVWPFDLGSGLFAAPRRLSAIIRSEWNTYSSRAD